MKNVTCFIYLLACIAIVISSCKKAHLNVPPVASMTVTNAIVGAGAIRVGSIVYPVFNNGYSQLSVIAGEHDLYVWPIGDSANPYYRGDKFYAENGSIYSLFMSGQLPNVTGVLVKDDIPYHSDSTCGIRIVNLSPNSPPVNITLSTSPNRNEVTNLSYLQYTNFKQYSAIGSITSYTFQIRDATNNSLLFTYSLPTPRFANVTLVFRGLIGGVGATGLGVIRVNNDRFF